MNNLNNRVGRKCSICGEFDMIKVGCLNCDDCEKAIIKKNKSLLEI